MIDDNLADFGQEREIDAARVILFVMAHKLDEFVNITKCRRGLAIEFADAINNRLSRSRIKAYTVTAENQLTSHAVGHRVAVENWMPVAHAESLEGVAESVTEIEGLAQAFLKGVRLDKEILNEDGASHHVMKKVIVNMVEIETEERVKLTLIMNEGVLNHLGKTRKEILAVERPKEIGAYEHMRGLGKDTNLIFERAEVHAGLAAERRVDLGKKSCGDIDEIYAALESSRAKAAEVAGHTTTEVDKRGFPRGAVATQELPYRKSGLIVLGVIASSYSYAVLRRDEVRSPSESLDAVVL